MNIALIVEIHSGGVHTRESVEMTKVIVNEQDLNASSQVQCPLRKNTKLTEKTDKLNKNFMNLKTSTKTTQLITKSS